MKLHSNHINTEYYTERSKQILIMRSHGKSRSEIADKINISSKRIESLIQDMVKDNDCINEMHLIATCLRNGVIQ